MGAASITVLAAVGCYSVSWTMCVARDLESSTPLPRAISCNTLFQVTLVQQTIEYPLRRAREAAEFTAGVSRNKPNNTVQIQSRAMVLLGYVPAPGL